LAACANEDESSFIRGKGIGSRNEEKYTYIFRNSHYDVTESQVYVTFEIARLYLLRKGDNRKYDTPNIDPESFW
jgi:transcription termination factor Rho